MKVLVAPESGAEARPIHGPADLTPFGPGAVVVVLGSPAPNDFARWAAPLGLAALRGADLIRRTA